jgi:hypothetical protein
MPVGLSSGKTLVDGFKVKGGRAGKLRFCQVRHELSLAPSHDLSGRHGNKLVADAEEAADRKDGCR